MKSHFIGATIVLLVSGFVFPQTVVPSGEENDDIAKYEARNERDKRVFKLFNEAYFRKHSFKIGFDGDGEPVGGYQIELRNRDGDFIRDRVYLTARLGRFDNGDITVRGNYDAWRSKRKRQRVYFTFPLVGRLRMSNEHSYLGRKDNVTSALGVGYALALPLGEKTLLDVSTDMVWIVGETFFPASCGVICDRLEEAEVAKLEEGETFQPAEEYVSSAEGWATALDLRLEVLRKFVVGLRVEEWDLDSRKLESQSYYNEELEAYIEVQIKGKGRVKVIGWGNWYERETDITPDMSAQSYDGFSGGVGITF
jgi:hypothetical protein